METESLSSCVDYLSDYDVSLASCCHCQQLPDEPVMLDCLHTCCRSCLKHDTAQEPTLQSSSSTECPVCSESTALYDVTSNSLLCNYKRLFPLSLETMCCSACDGDDVAAAVFWCADCYRGLCLDCNTSHNRFTRRHRSAELGVARKWRLSQLLPAVQCDSHKRSITEQCFTCRKPQCYLCCAPCKAEKHQLQPLSHGETSNYITTTIGAIHARQKRLLRVVSGVQKKCGRANDRLRGKLAADGRRMLVQGKRSLCDSTVRTYDRSVVEVCANLQRIWYMCTDVISKPPTQKQAELLATSHIQLLVTFCQKSLELHCERGLFSTVSHRFLSSDRTLLTRRVKYWQENGVFSIVGAVPSTADVTLRSCLGATYQRRAAPPAPLLFGQVTVAFRAPVPCDGLAVTRDGHVLLAAREHGLLVYSDRGQQLSSWTPERQNDGEEDTVLCVAALSDGRAAVGVGYAQLVVLLRRSETGGTWLDDCRVAVLQSSPWRLAAHSDLLAVAEYRRDEQQQSWVYGCQVKLLRLSSGHLLYSHTREYDIYTVALTALCLLTVSYGQVKRNSGVRPYVLDAFSHSGEFLWRHETSDEEVMNGLCVLEDTWRRVYAAVLKEDWSSSRVMAFSVSDRRDVREVISSRTHLLQVPLYLSLARVQQRTVLAVLEWDREAKQTRIVSLYEATSSE